MNMKKRIGLFVSLMVVFVALTGCKHDFGKNNEKVKVTIGQLNFDIISRNARAAENESTLDPNEFEYMVICKDSKGNADVGLNASSISIDDKISYETLSELSFSLQPDSYSFTLDVYYPSLDDFTDYENVTSLVFTKTISMDITADMTDFALTFDLEKAENAMGVLNLYYYLGTATYENLEVSYKFFKTSDYMNGKRTDTDCVMEVSVSEQSDREYDYLVTNVPLLALDESYIITGNVLYEEEGTWLPLRKTEIVKVMPGKTVDANFYDPSYGQSEADKIYSVKLNVVGPDGNPLVTKSTTDTDWNENICRTQLEGCNFVYSDSTVEIKSSKNKFMELPILKNQTIGEETYYFYGWYFDKEGKIPAFNTSFIAGPCGGDTGRFSEDSTYLELFGVDLHGNVPMLYPKWKKSYKLYAVDEMQWDGTKDVAYVNDEGTNVREVSPDGKYIYELTPYETNNYYLEGFYYDAEFTMPLFKDEKYDWDLYKNVPVYLVNEDYDFEGDVYVYAKYIEPFVLTVNLNEATTATFTESFEGKYKATSDGNSISFYQKYDQFPWYEMLLENIVTTEREGYTFGGVTVGEGEKLINISDSESLTIEQINIANFLKDSAFKYPETNDSLKEIVVNYEWDIIPTILAVNYSSEETYNEETEEYDTKETYDLGFAKADNATEYLASQQVKKLESSNVKTYYSGDKIYYAVKPDNIEYSEIYRIKTDSLYEYRLVPEFYSTIKDFVVSSDEKTVWILTSGGSITVYYPSNKMEAFITLPEKDYKEGAIAVNSFGNMIYTGYVCYDSDYTPVVLFNEVSSGGDVQRTVKLTGSEILTEELINFSNTQVTDLIVQDGYLCFLVYASGLFESMDAKVASTGVVGRIDLSTFTFDESFSSGANQIGFSTNIIKSADKTMIAPDNTDDPLFFGPRQFIAVVPKKLVIADCGYYLSGNIEYDGYYYWYGEYSNISRVVTVDLEKKTVSNVVDGLNYVKLSTERLGKDSNYYLRYNEDGNK